MSVLRCNRNGCENVMCDRYSSEFGYICEECFSELEYYCKMHSRVGISNAITTFMNSPKSADEVCSHIIKDYIKEYLCKEFTDA